MSSHELRGLQKAANEFHASLLSSGMTEEQLCREFGVSKPTVSRWIARKNLPHPAMWKAMMITFDKYSNGMNVIIPKEVEDDV